MAVDLKSLWKKVSPGSRCDLKTFIADAADGDCGTSQRDILQFAKRQFGAKPDWPAILAVLMTYLPFLLALLK